MVHLPTSHVNRQTSVKTLPSPNFVCRWYIMPDIHSRQTNLHHLHSSTWICFVCVSGVHCRHVLPTAMAGRAVTSQHNGDDNVRLQLRWRHLVAGHVLLQRQGRPLPWHHRRKRLLPTLGKRERHVQQTVRNIFVDTEVSMLIFCIV